MTLPLDDSISIISRDNLCALQRCTGKQYHYGNTEIIPSAAISRLGPEMSVCRYWLCIVIPGLKRSVL
jgi:hypothetical protein